METVKFLKSYQPLLRLTEWLEERKKERKTDYPNKVTPVCVN